MTDSQANDRPAGAGERDRDDASNAASSVPVSMPFPPARMRRMAFLGSLAAVAAGALVLARTTPHEQVVTIVLGDAAQQVEEVSLTYAEAKGQGRGMSPRGSADDRDDVPLRVVTLHYEKGRAPRTLRHEVRLADGDYAFEIELRSGEKRATIHRVGTLSGGSLTLDVSRALSP